MGRVKEQGLEATDSELTPQTTPQTWLGADTAANTAGHRQHRCWTLDLALLTWKSKRGCGCCYPLTKMALLLHKLLAQRAEAWVLCPWPGCEGPWEIKYV